MSNYLQIETGIPASDQEHTFQNATLTGLDNGLAVSIAITPPGQDQRMTEDELAAKLRTDLLPLAKAGYLVEIKIGPDK